MGDVNSDGEQCDMWGNSLEDFVGECSAAGPRGTGCVLEEGHQGEHEAPEDYEVANPEENRTHEPFGPKGGSPSDDAMRAARAFLKSTGVGRRGTAEDWVRETAVAFDEYRAEGVGGVFDGGPTVVVGAIPIAEDLAKLERLHRALLQEEAISLWRVQHLFQVHLPGLVAACRERNQLKNQMAQQVVIKRLLVEQRDQERADNERLRVECDRSNRSLEAYDRVANAACKERDRLAEENENLRGQLRALGRGGFDPEEKG